MKHPAPLRVLWAHHKPTVLLLSAALLLALFFAARFALHAVYWHQAQGTRPQPEPWMTPKYVANAWHLPPEEIRIVLHLSETPSRQTLEDIANTQNRPIAAVLADLDAFLHKHAAPRP